MRNVAIASAHEKIYLIGIGGISMSALAEIFYNLGCKVSGSDKSDGSIVYKLRNKGITVFTQHVSDNIKSVKPDLVIYTAAIAKDNEELRYARDNNIKVMDRAQFLGELMKSYKYTIAVAGTHGKTSTTGMVSDIFLQAGMDPTITLGGILKSVGNNFVMGKSDYFILEACEYFNSFLSFKPYVAIILNIEEDHLDYFKDLDSIYDAFHNFANNVSEDGYLIINANIPNYERIVRNIKCTVITYGNKEADWKAYNILSIEKDYYVYDLISNNSKLVRIKLKAQGLHNIENSIAAFIAAYVLNLGVEKIQLGLKSFGGIKRRFELKGYFNGAVVLDDYAHHPTEIKATLKTAKIKADKRLYAVFQPHTYSRTKFLLEEFANAFNLADIIIIMDIYRARENNIYNIHSIDLVNKIKEKNPQTYYFKSKEVINRFLIDNLSEGDLLITMGAGDVYLVGEQLLLTDLSTLSTEQCI